MLLLYESALDAKSQRRSGFISKIKQLKSLEARNSCWKFLLIVASYKADTGKVNQVELHVFNCGVYVGRFFALNVSV